MKPVQFACLVIVAAVGTANPLGPSLVCTWEDGCSTGCKRTPAEANCASNNMFPIQKSDDCYVCCRCIPSPEY
ncbi:hypothetical protein K503DRAFT_765623 [Rhizopogon vinicolor AM-OR11-026]|uniref:Uncharacterized protein n=1 Tax=Rhizopogon vinicolor AM-OR11-026 TaxID=1314800 RepID=A0A1B7NFZ2_9AGAM|nr:hypothetical protein K503DRAFT_765623 [Rhizopogon vinicolor AM-OR11-026]